MKNTTMQARKPMPPMRSKGKRATLTLGDLISAAYQTLGETRAVTRVLRSSVMSRHIGRKLVFL